MKHATFLGILFAIGCCVLTVSLELALFASAKGNPPIDLSSLGQISLLVSGVLGLAFRQWWYHSGMKMVLSAQQMLVAIDTEHNTRGIAEILRENQTVKS
jgi:hypothetical protein